jgi:hypothetical protein
MMSSMATPTSKPYHRALRITVSDEGFKAETFWTANGKEMPLTSTGFLHMPLGLIERFDAKFPRCPVFICCAAKAKHAEEGAL